MASESEYALNYLDMQGLAMSRSFGDKDFKTDRSDLNFPIANSLENR